MAKVAIVGLGLIGGSLARALEDHHEIVGIDPDAATRDLAREAGLAAVPNSEAARALEGADLVVLATPLPSLGKVLINLADLVPPGAVVTDVGSVKGPIVAIGRRHLEGSFVGGHPMAGTVGQGFAASRGDLFRGASWALTPETAAEHAAATRVREILEPTGARFVEMAAAAHDRAVAFTSHVPYLTALALARAVQGAEKEGIERVLDLIGPGFRDTTRLALTPPELGQAMAMENEEAVLLGLAALRYQISQIEVLIQHRMGKELRMFAQSAAQWRDQLP